MCIHRYLQNRCMVSLRGEAQAAEGTRKGLMQKIALGLNLEGNQRFQGVEVRRGCLQAWKPPRVEAERQEMEGCE